MLPAALSGLATGLSLIVAIGAQNAFVLRQGLQRRFVPLVVAVCALSDLVLILAGVAGVGALVRRAPAVLTGVRFVGAVFLAGYGLLALRRAVGGQDVGDAPETADRSRGRVLATCLAFTWLNPHVYLDTVLLLGSIAATHGNAGRWAFGAGAGVGSIAWFTALGFGARLLAPLFRRRAAWRVLDAVIAAVMLGLATALALG